MPILGSLPGFNDTQMNDPVVPLWSATVNYTLNSDDVRRGELRARLAPAGGLRRSTAAAPNFCTAGFPVNPLSNQLTNGLAALPTLFPDANVVDPSYYNYDALTEVSPAYFDGTRVQPAADLHSGAAASPTRRRTTPIPGFADYSAVKDFAVSVTKVWGRHTIKTGYYKQSAAKRQNQGNPFGTLSFANDANNPLDSGFGYANAVLGVFSSFNQASRFIEGSTSTPTTRPTSRTTGR